MSRDRFRPEDEFGVEGDVIEIDPIEILGEGGRSPYSTAPGGKTLPVRTTGDHGPGLVTDAIARALEAVYPDFDNGELPLGKGLGTYRPEAVAEGMADVLTLGHTDELMGGIAAAQGEDYTGTRDRVRDQQERTREEFPAESRVGTGLGIAAALPLMGGGASAETAMGRIGTGVAEGMGFGAIGASGASEEAPLTEEWAGDVVEGGTGGAVLGGVIGGGGELVRGGLRRLIGDPADRARRAALQRVRQAGPGRMRELEKIDMRGGAEEVVGDLRQANPEVFGRRGWATSDRVGQNIADVADAARQQREAIRAQMQGQPVDTAPIVDALERRLADLGTGPESRSLRRALRDWIADYRASGRLPFEELERRRQTVGGQLNVEARNPSQMESIRRALYGAIREAQTAGVDAATGMGEAWRRSGRELDLGIRLGDIGGREELREAARTMGSLSDYGAMAMGEGRGESPMGGAIGWAANRLWQGVEPATRANWNEAMGRAARAGVPQRAGEAMTAAGRGAAVTDAPQQAGAAVVDAIRGGADDGPGAMPAAAPIKPVDMDADIDEGALDALMPEAGDDVDEGAINALLGD